MKRVLLAEDNAHMREGIHPEKQEHYMEIIGQEADHMNELLNSMLIYTRVTDTFYQLQKEECFLETMAREVADITRTFWSRFP